MRGYPAIEEAERLLREAESCNPGPWGNHSRIAARCAQKIAAASGMDTEKAYVLGLLHDIGRRFGKGHLAHVYDGHWYMQYLGYDAAARICLTHSFPIQTLSAYIGNRDIFPGKQEELSRALAAVTYDDYDRLIQLCDCLAGSEGVMDMAARMEDIRFRYGSYPQDKWDANMALRVYFEKKTGTEMYRLLGENR